jgi:hypothetical protein
VLEDGRGCCCCSRGWMDGDRRDGHGGEADDSSTGRKGARLLLLVTVWRRMLLVGELAPTEDIGLLIVLPLVVTPMGVVVVALRGFWWLPFREDDNKFLCCCNCARPLWFVGGD